MTAWWQTPVKALDESARAQASQRQNTLTKPPGSLGRLEEVAIALAAMQGCEKPQIKQPSITVFAGDHGVVAEGVAAFPQAVTQLMLVNFVAGGAAISVLAREQNARLEVVDVGTLAAETIDGVVNDKSASGTANLAWQPAMTPAQLDHALAAGHRAVERALATGADLFIGGEMGIGNTTPAAAIGCALLSLRGADLAGPGTGLNEAGVSHKAQVIDRALALHGFLPSPASGGGAGGEGGLRPAQTRSLPAEILTHARELRKNQTDAEQLLWAVLRAKRFMDLKFRRQHTVEPYIVDFYCDSLKLVIELDGGQHAEQQAYDQARAAFLENKGITVLRFWNNQVLAETEAVLEAIYWVVLQRQPQPLPSPPAPLPLAGEGRKPDNAAVLFSLPSPASGGGAGAARDLADVLGQPSRLAGSSIREGGLQPVQPKPALVETQSQVSATEVLRRLGGFEIAALSGAYIACAQAGLPVLVDGFITTAAALAACRMNPGVRDWLMFAHASTEPGHAHLLAALDARPLLQLDMRLGEGSGAATALPILRLACALHEGMATFAEAGIQSTGQSTGQTT
jgi:nicotinate-nucleotide--dimethylbenzimidazole phosphoribosyltransferase